MKKFFSLTLLGALLWAGPIWAAPALSPERLEAEIGARLERVPEFAFIRAEAEKVGAKAYLFGGTSAAYSHYVREDLLREAGDSRFPPHRFDYDYTNIFRSTQDLDVVIDGTAEQAEALERALVSKYPHFIGDKGAGWEVRPLRVARGAKEAILENPNFLNQHTDSHSTGLVEITKPSPGSGTVRDVRDWQSRKPQFLRDVTEARLHYYFNPLHEKTERAAKGLNPPILSVIRYLTKAFQYGLEIRPEDLPLIRKIIADFQPAALNNDYLQRWVEKNGKKLFQHAVDLEYAWNTLEELGLRKKLADIQDNPNTLESLSWWMNKEPLRTRPLGQGDGVTAEEAAKKLKIPKLVVAHETNSYLAYESITRQRGGELNALISRNKKAGEAAAYGEGFYTRRGRQGARNTGFTIRMEIDPRARLGTDFTMVGDFDYVVLKNKAAAKVIAEQINISMPEYFRMLAEGKSFSSDDKALLEQFYRRAAKNALISPEDEAFIVKIVRENLLKRKPRLALISEWLRLPLAEKYPEIVAHLLEKGDQKTLEMFAREVFPHPKWEKHPQLVQKLIERANTSVHSELFIHTFSKPHWARHPELVAQFFRSDAPLAFPSANSVGSKSGLTFATWFAQNIMPEPAWAAHPELVKTVIASTSHTHSWSLIAGKLAAPHWQQHPDLLQALINTRSPIVYNSLAWHTFTQKHWAQHPQMLEQMIDSVHEDDILSNIARILGLPFWRENTALQKKVFDKGGLMVRVELAKALGPDSKLADFRAILQQAIRKGPAAIREEVAVALMDKQWWPEKDLMQALLDKGDANALERLATYMPPEYFDESPEVLDQLLRSKSKQVQVGAVKNAFYRSGPRLRDIPAAEWLLANASTPVVGAMHTWVTEREPQARAKYIQIMLDRNDKAIDEIIAGDILKNANSTDQAEAVRTIIRRGDRETIGKLVRLVLDDAQWAKHPDLISEVIQVSQPNALKELVWPILSKDYWPNRSELIVQMMERGEGPVARELAQHIYNFSWEQERAIYEQVLARGTRQGRENVARLLLIYSNLKERAAFAKPLLLQGDPQIQKLLRASASSSLKKSLREIDPQLVDLLSAQILAAPTCASTFANLAPVSTR